VVCWNKKEEEEENGKRKNMSHQEKIRNEGTHPRIVVKVGI